MGKSFFGSDGQQMNLSHQAQKFVRNFARHHPPLVSHRCYIASANHDKACSVFNPAPEHVADS